MQINLNDLHEVYSQEPVNNITSYFDLKNVNLSMEIILWLLISLMQLFAKMSFQEVILAFEIIHL